MSFPRLAFIVLPVAIGLPLLAGACGAPLAVTAAGYGADGLSLAQTNKTAADHFTSMVSKKDCALWRIFRNQDVCRARNGDHDPYDVNYTEPFRQGGEGGIEYLPPPHAAADAPSASWDAKAYAGPNADSRPPTSMTAAAGQTSTPVTQAADVTRQPPVAASRPTSATKPAGKHAAKRKRLKKKHAPSQAATAL